MFCRDLHINVFLVFYKKICLKEGEFGPKVFSDKIIVTLVTLGLSSPLLSQFAKLHYFPFSNAVHPMAFEHQSKQNTGYLCGRGQTECVTWEFPGNFKKRSRPRFKHTGI